VAQDYVESYKWTSLAAAQGNESAKKTLPFIKLEMTSEQIAEAQRLVREFKPRMALDSGIRTTQDISR
jgi:TPR repeat protein